MEFGFFLREGNENMAKKGKVRSEVGVIGVGFFGFLKTEEKQKQKQKERKKVSYLAKCQDERKDLVLSF